MSAYLSNLLVDPIARERYELKLFGVSEKEDPYALWNMEKL